MSAKTRKKYRLFLIVTLGLVITAISASVSNISYDYVKKNDDAKASLSYEEKNNTNKVWASGEPIGIYVKTKGVMVTGVSAFEDKNGNMICPCKDVVRVGDYIDAVNGVEVKNKVDFMNKLELANGDEICLSLVRNEKKVYEIVRAVLNTNDEYRLGLWVKDDIAGIGTLTYVDGEKFAALGHSINDNDTGEKFDISDGAIYNARLVNIKKPEGKTPGKLEGVIDYSSKNIIGRVETNENFGISGYLTVKKPDNYISGDDIGWVLMGGKTDAHTGPAYIISSISGSREKYSINIEAINRDSNVKEKNMEIKVTDEKLLQMTEGIIQGMSGSPIIQDGKLIGAVTHVFVNDSTKGYGIFIEEML